MQVPSPLLYPLLSQLQFLLQRRVDVPEQDDLHVCEYVILRHTGTVSDMSCTAEPPGGAGRSEIWYTGVGELRGESLNTLVRRAALSSTDLYRRRQVAGESVRGCSRAGRHVVVGVRR